MGLKVILFVIVLALFSTIKSDQNGIESDNITLIDDTAMSDKIRPKWD